MKKAKLTEQTVKIKLVGNECFDDLFSYMPAKKYFAYVRMIKSLNDKKHPLRKLFPGTVMISDCPAGYKMHHAWQGGLLDHYIEMLKWMFRNNNGKFTNSDMIEAVILHDISKVFLYRFSSPEEFAKDGYMFRYIKRERGLPQLNDEYLTLFMMQYFNLNVSWDVFLAVCFAEGGWSDISKIPDNQTNKLGYFLHMADLYSSQILGKK